VIFFLKTTSIQQYQLVQVIQKLSYNNQFFPNGGGDHRRIPSNPEATTSLHTQETHVEEKADVASVETKILGRIRLQRGEEKILRGGQLSKLAKRWRSINGYTLVRRGIMPIYTNKPMAEKYWEENLKFEEFCGTKRKNKIMKEKIQDAIKNAVLVETPKHLIHWCNQYRLVPKTNGDMRLVVEI
jgi:hypothetical protein